MESYAEFKIVRSLLCKNMWANLIQIMLNKKRQTQKSNYLIDAQFKTRQNSCIITEIRSVATSGTMTRMEHKRVGF